MMNKKNKCILGVLVCLGIYFAPRVAAQVTYLDFDEPLSKEQMYQDFDSLIRITEGSTQALVRQISTGYDAAGYLKKQRYRIENLHTLGDFIKFVNRCLPYIMGAHVRSANAFDALYCLGKHLIDTSALQIIAQKIEEQEIEAANNTMQKGFPLGIGFYCNGEYHVFGRFKFIHRETLDTTTVSDFRILEHQQKPVDFFGEIESSAASWNRWDHRRHQFFTKYGINGFCEDHYLVEDYPSKKIYDIKGDEYNLIMGGSSLPREEYAKLKRENKIEKTDNMKITYFDSLKLLYLYLGSMDDDGGAFAEEVKRIGKGKKINKIIIDIRGNRGGSDATWARLLTAIIKKPLKEDAQIVVRNTPVMNRIIDSETRFAQMDTNYFKKKRIPYLNNEEFHVFYSGGGQNIFLPDSNSLQYDGNIYILQDLNSLSASGTFSAYAKLIDQLISVGEPTGTIAGRGLMPAIFQLPNSKYTFAMEITADITLAKNAFDVWQDRPEIEIYPSADDIIERNNYNVINLRSKEFLLNHDYLFKKVLEMK
jgi:hypothetical protein